MSIAINYSFFCMISISSTKFESGTAELTPLRIVEKYSVLSSLVCKMVCYKPCNCYNGLILHDFVQNFYWMGKILNYMTYIFTVYQNCSPWEPGQGYLYTRYIVVADFGDK